MEVETMKYVYVVLCGCIGDISIHRIYSSEKKAKAEVERMYKDNYLKYTEPYIEKWEVK